MKKLTLLGPVAAVALLYGLFEDNVPTHSSTGAIDGWLAATGNAGWMVHSASIALGGVLLAVFAQAVVVRLGEDDVLSRAVGSLGTMLGGLAVAGAGLFGAIPVGRFFEHSPEPGADVYRYLMAASASVFVIFAAVPAAALAAGVGALCLRSAYAPRWLGWTGVAMGALILLSALVAPLMVFGLWLALTGVTLTVTGGERRGVVRAGRVSSRTA